MEKRTCNMCIGTGLGQYPTSKGCYACNGKGYYLINPNLNTEGTCPKCYEYTQAEESCCGYGAYVEGSLMSEDYARERLGLDD